MESDTDSEKTVAGTVSTRVMELVVAGLFMAVAAVVIWDSLRVGIGWAFDGPQPGYFPFYIGVIMFIASAVTFGYNLFTRRPNLKTFVGRTGLKLVLQVLVPCIAYVVLVRWLGLYVAAAIFISSFMVWLGKYSVVRSLVVGISVPLIFFIVFEIFFLIPLPKGPLERALGF